MKEILSIQNLRKSFGEKQVLKDVTLSLKEGENLAILGRSGSGKSVLIKCIVGLILPDGGNVRVLDHTLDAEDPDSLVAIRKCCGFLFQGGALYDSMTLGDNLRFTLANRKPELNLKTREEQVIASLEQVGLEESIDKYPSELSGGMQKRASLARTIITKPRIILYDEPTTGLDAATSREISELIIRLRDQSGVSSIIITHDIPCVKACANRISILKDGSIHEEGDYQRVRHSADPFTQSLFYTL